MISLTGWFSTREFMPHGFCYQWNPGLVWLHVISDLLIALAYFSIPIALVYFVRRRRDIPFSWMFVCFSVFIAACGATHVMDVWTIWVPSYWLSGAFKAVTALASLPTAAFLFRLLPRALSLPSPEEMRAANEELSRQSAILKEGEERFRQMAENIQEVFWTMNPDTLEVTYVSPGFEQICELAVQQIYSNPTLYRELIHPDDRERVLAQLAQLPATNGFEEQFRIVCPSGKVKWLKAIAFNAKDSAGIIRTFVGTAQEITRAKEIEFALRESEDHFRDLVEHCSDLICTYNLEGRLLTVNELPAKLLGYSREELLSRPMHEFLPPEAREKFYESLVAVQRDGFVKGLLVVLTKTGERRLWEYHNTLRTDGVTTPVVRGIAHDVTDEKRMVRALRLSEEKFSKAFLASPYAIVISTMEEGRLMDVNDSFLQIMGLSYEETIGQTSSDLGIWVNPSDREQILTEIKNKGRVQSKQIKCLTKRGRQLDFNYSAEVLELEGRNCLLSVCEDITERKRVEEELRRLSGHILRLQDEERRKIARDLHDATGQDLVALTATLGQIRGLVPSSNRKCRKLLSQCVAVANHSLQEVRTLSYLLHPPMLDEAGLVDAIRHFVGGFSERTGIMVNIDASSHFGRLPQETELGLFRVVQESLVNIQRHSGSYDAKIELARDSKIINLQVTDHGRGISGGCQKKDGAMLMTCGVGIPSMEERVKQVGGRLEIQSGCTGTTVRVTVPLHG